MVIDSSAIVAILLREPGHEELEAAIQADNFRMISLASILEIVIVCIRRQVPDAEVTVSRRLSSLNVYRISVTNEQLALACDAYRRYGKGLHPAALNFGDCFSYALAKLSKEPLLFKGNDFSQTDIACA